MISSRNSRKVRGGVGDGAKEGRRELNEFCLMCGVNWYVFLSEIGHDLCTLGFQLGMF